MPPVILPDPVERLSGGGAQAGQRGQLLVGGLVAQLDKGGGQADALSHVVHGHFALLVLVGVEQAGDEAGGVNLDGEGNEGKEERNPIKRGKIKSEECKGERRGLRKRRRKRKKKRSKKKR